MAETRQNIIGMTCYCKIHEYIDYVVDVYILYRYIMKINPSELKPTPSPIGLAIYGSISGIAAYSSEQHIYGEEIVVRRY